VIGFFSLLSLVYIGIGVQTLVRVVRSWSSLWDDSITADDQRLAARAAFYLLIPPTVALHELGHAIAIWAYGLQVVDFRFLGYMGFVVPSASAGPLGDFWVALIGNLVTLLLGVLALGFGLFRPGHPVRNILAIELGRQQLFLVLAFYPAISIGANQGDFRWIYNFDQTPLASGITAALHALIAGGGYLWWLRRMKTRAMVLCSPAALHLPALERRLAADPGDRQANAALVELYLRAGDLVRARRCLDRIAADGGGLEPRSRLAYAELLLITGEAGRALEELEAALPRLFAPEDRRAAELVRVKVLTALGRASEAIGAAEALRADPVAASDPRLVVLWARAMAAASRRAEARSEVERLFERAEGEARRTLRVLLDELR
jgi:tetratricopeptide (TPR) repeat protein